LLVALEIFDKQFSAIDIRYQEREPREARVRVRLERLQTSPDVDLDLPCAVLEVVVAVGPGSALGRVIEIDKLAVVSNRLPVRQGIVPEKSGGRIGKRVVAVIGITAHPAAKGSFQVIGYIGLVDPGMAVGAEYAAAVEIVEERKLTGESMLIRGNRFTENH